MITVHTAVLPTDADPTAVRDDVVVVVDVLRATSTIAVAIHGGATVVPVATLDQARTTAAQVEGRVVLAGERQGLRPEGFDLGNSPRALAQTDLTDTTLVMTTTNGTKAVERFRPAAIVLAGALVNARAVARFVVAAGRSRAWLVCSGRAGGTKTAVEDTIGCGAIAHHLQQDAPSDVRFDEQTRSAVEAYVAADDLSGPSAEYLASIGAGSDVAFCARRNAVDVVPLLVEGRFRSAD